MSVREEIGEPALLELLAEECTELAHAALKLARVERRENPTPKNKAECVNSLIEEWADVAICLGEISEAPWAGDGTYFEKVYDAKMARMNERLAESKRVCSMYSKCQRCGRKLTDPGNMARGYGPECWRDIAGSVRETMHPPDKRPLPGQMSIFDFTDPENLGKYGDEVR